MSEIPMPAPLLPPTVDLRDYEWMPLDVARLRDSKTVTKVRAEEFRAAVLLWCASWHQVPAASLPDDEDELAKFAGYGIAVREFRKVRVGAMRGFVKCSDGRYYHPVVVEKAIDSWIRKLEQKHRSECARLKKWNQRHKDEHVDVPGFKQWITCEYPESVPLMSSGQLRRVSGDSTYLSSGQDPNVPDLFAPPDKTGHDRTFINNQLRELETPEASTVPGDNPTPRPEGRKSTPRADGSWRRDPQAAMRKLSALGVSPSWSSGKSHPECVQRIEEELHKQHSRNAA